MSGSRERRSIDDAPDRGPEDDEQSIIDVFEFDDTAQDRWLYSTGASSRRNSLETKVEDLDAWLHEDVAETEAAQSDFGSRKSIDTRTFTRIKRRSNKLNFDGMDASPETKPFSLSNVWKHQSIPESPTQTMHNNSNKDQSQQKEKKDSIPMMLRPKTNQVLAAFLSESPSSITSQTSMEAFLNMARSKEGVNSLLSDMSEPDVNHFLMNISQPSLLYSSIISDGKGDESIHMPLTESSMIDSQILTDSMMEASMFKEVQDTNMLANFLKQNDCTILENKTFCKSPNDADKTFVNENMGDRTYLNITDRIPKSSNSTFIANENLNSCNSTFIAAENVKTNETFVNSPSPNDKDVINSTKILSSQEDFLNVTQVIANAPKSLNTTETIQSSNVLSNQKDALSLTQTINHEKKTDLSFDITSTSLLQTEDKFGATFEASSTPANPNSRIKANTLDATFNAVPNLRSELLQEVRRHSGKFDVTFTDIKMTNIESKLDATYLEEGDDEILDATYVQEPECENDKKSPDATFDSNPAVENAASTQRMSYLRKNSIESHTISSDPNRFNTFRKDSKMSSRLSKALQTQGNNLNKTTSVTAPLQPHVANTNKNDITYQQRFNTFSKKTSTIRNSIAIESEDYSESKFTKPKQMVAPRQLSKLPQLFQKSNPNLGSSIKPLGKALKSDSTFNKGSQPNVSSNIYTLGRFKSEQRLLQAKHNSEFPVVDGTSRSMESIESTASAHSAPDLDDRLSSCSDVSRASYTIKPRNIEVLKKMASIEDQGKFGESTPKTKSRQILENTWVEEKDLPSPIFKNGTARYAESGESRSASSADSTEFSVKTSSPLNISPCSSENAINAIANYDAGIEAAKENIQATENVRPKQLKAPSSTSSTTNATKLRRPTNYAGAPNKVSNGATSGIPRPASRIPAPKFTRPNVK